MDLIDRQAAIDALYHVDEYNGRSIEAIRNLPSVTPKQKRGKWEEKAVSDEKVIDEWQSARCSACGKYHTAPYMYYFNNYNFCPNCGADMRGEQDDESRSKSNAQTDTRARGMGTTDKSSGI